MILIFILLAALCAAYWFTTQRAKAISAHFPNTGRLTDIGGYRLNALHIPATPSSDLPPIVFLHGASGNFRDQETAFRRLLTGRAEMLFVDRPGHGYSERGGPENDRPDGQADAIACLMDKLGIEKAVISGHSFGGAIAMSFALRHPDKTAGLMLIAPATHPWDGDVDWYYKLSAHPRFGWLFTHLFTLPAGLVLMDKATQAVFHPNQRPHNYIEDAATALVLRPDNFRYNAIDLTNLNTAAAAMAPHYNTIKTPTVVITGDSDKIVSPAIHARGIVESVLGAKLVTIRGLGHKPDYIATDVVIAGIEVISGKDRDLDAVAKVAEAWIAPKRDEPEPELDFSIEKG
ncbi:alpha/beta fold hydrolase [Neorhizobium alkalisoli]|uniref:Pimeloyl-ACP methyl ester carboxylesterase n=1 Tax=Neorhizobium alkalisoli TaxID=528178 RepID=A0A561QXG2_9HYPH|nr:alpha/beta hydrolase [Neorhizobium alkalisoli]TWF55064.1 pimeloyl-ACP methyl ester carboxylesterase [Neorhizobium alkalisoli]